jgi:molybdenum cofactor cytidylyltransferase
MGFFHREGHYMCEGLILAGGYSSRAGTNKMLLSIEGNPVILRAIERLLECCTQVIVVTGHYHKALNEILDPIPRVSVVYNANYDQGMFSSVQCGVAHLSEDFLMLPGDYPNIQRTTIEQLLRTEGDIVVPTYNNRRGHPIFIRQALIEPLLKEPITSTLKDFRNRQKVTYIEVEDQGILEDMDTIEAYNKLKRQIEGS